MKFKRLIATAMASMLTLTGVFTLAPASIANAANTDDNGKGIAFIGDSICQGCNWASLFGRADIDNYGVGGNTSTNVMERFSEAYGNYEKVFIICGVNDWSVDGWNNGSYSGSMANYEEMFKLAYDNIPGAQVYVTGILPTCGRYTSYIDYNQSQSYNSKLRALADEYEHVTYVDGCWDALLDKTTGYGNTAYYRDGLHPNEDGYQELKKVMQPYVDEVIDERIILDCDIKYQIRGSYDARFVGEADAEQIEAATSAKAALSVAGYDDPDNFVAVEGSPETITKAYKSIVANGQKIEADEGKCFLVTSPINVPDGNKAKAVFSIDGLAGESERTVEIGNVPESSSEEESSSEPDSSSEVEDSSSEAEGTEVIWTGSEKISWSSEVELAGVEGVKNAKAGGILTVYYDSTSSAQIQIINKIGEDWTWTEMLSADGNNYFDAVGGKLQIKLTAEQAQQLIESRAMYLKGSGATVTKITYTSPEAFAGTTETIWEGSESLGSWNKDVDIKAAGIPLAEEGGIVTVYYESTGSAQISVINKVGSSWKWTPLISPEGNEYYDTSGGKLQIKLTAEQAEQFATSKAIFFKGQNATITKLTYTAPGGSEGIREVLWTGSEDLGSWDKDVDLKVAGYSLAEAGGVLTIKYESKGAAQISVINKVGTGWVWTPMVSSEGNEYFDTTGGTLEITLTAEQAEQLATSKAMFLKGQNAVVTEIVYTYK